jgi:hypothetical protein
VSLSGDRFFYVNPLASSGKHHRVPWFDCACCPPNVLRFFASMPQRIYATTTSDIYVNMYTPSEAEISVGGGRVRLKQETKYPWDGKVTLIVEPQTVSAFGIRLRMPRWCEKPQAKLAGGEPQAADDRGYVSFKRTWKTGDKIELDFPMPVRRLRADPRVKANVGRVAIGRGPIVYCVEGVDNGGAATALKLPGDVELKAEHRADLLGGVTVIKAGSLAAVPYYAWDNREPGEMAVWIPE